MARRDGSAGAEILILQEEFEYIRNTFFPRWDKKRQWKIVLDPDLPSIGRSDSKKKLIIVRNHPEQAEDFHLLLIHEIAHAVGATGHWKKWQTRLLKAADRADQIGRKELASAIRAEVEQYRSAEVVGAEEIYGLIYDYVSDTKGEVPYENIINTIARDQGLYPEELEKSYKKCRREYDNAVRELREYKEIEQHAREQRRKLGIEI